MPGHIDKKLIYIVDDDEDVLILLKKILQNLGMEVEAFLTPELFIEKFKQKIPDLCFLDLNYGVHIGGGFQLIKALRKKNPEKLILIALSAREASEDITHALEIGCNDYLTKPVRAPIIESKLRQHFMPTTDLALPMIAIEDEQLHPCIMELNYYLHYISEDGFTILSPHFIPKKTKIEFDSGIIFEIMQKKFSLKAEHNWLSEESHLYATFFKFPDDDRSYQNAFRNWKLISTHEKK